MFLVMFDEVSYIGDKENLITFHSDLPSTSTASNEMEVDVTVGAGDLADEASFFEPTRPQEDGE